MVAGAGMMTAAAAEQAGVFISLSGDWSGDGTVNTNSGTTERIRCRASYVVNKKGDNLQQELRCASDSYKFELYCDISFANGFVTGRWNERTQKTSGTISGRAAAGQIDALAETSGFAAFFTMVTRGDRQSVRIESKSPEISDVTITLRRASR
jgi:hypothetical protein